MLRETVKELKKIKARATLLFVKKIQQKSQLLKLASKSYYKMFSD
jgi:hypothetical protein